MSDNEQGEHRKRAAQELDIVTCPAPALYRHRALFAELQRQLLLGQQSTQEKADAKTS